MKPTSIYFIRHGEVHNPKAILYGRLPNFPLSTKGRERINEVADYFINKGVNQIYTSPMLRARQTAQIIGSKLKLRPKVNHLLNEVKLIFGGIPISEYHSKIQSKLYDEEYLKKGQESVERIADRMMRFCKMIKKKYTGETLIVVSHGDPILILQSAILKRKFTWEYKRDNYLKTGYWIKVLFEEDKWKII
ncbi:hypothetical protein A2960_03760 [Candidatus Gottesmanbacteria bacterium RIFCSPLOWO2_01_FULL_39_12b]|uniref:Phosphoglycerate mutase n=1 Tax=Candidatus Gottesmanbacteria bacterium RIFCSPLOWO2_01_FULL_39_12b TaxID=1798388 RepID=A0A1F6AQ04_9BACT|nr:MAG: hypothetical protein A2960_03760 [Candidatus Gottesmanbacteria bacterium RIFCSPLOWO2_01_FULL_39_12b]